MAGEHPNGLNVISQRCWVGPVCAPMFGKSQLESQNKCGQLSTDAAIHAAKTFLYGGDLPPQFLSVEWASECDATRLARGHRAVRTSARNGSRSRGSR